VNDEYLEMNEPADEGPSLLCHMMLAGKTHLWPLQFLLQQLNKDH